MSLRTHFTDTESILLQVCRTGCGEFIPAGDLPALATAGAQLIETCTLADGHGALGLFLARLDRGGFLAAGAGQWVDQLRATLEHQRRRARLYQFECRMILAALRASGLEPVLLKGAALQVLIYDEPAERLYGDIDVLVPEAQIDATTKVLEALGYTLPAGEVASRYEALHFHYILTKPGGFRVEVHWALEGPRSPFHLDPRDFIANTLTVESPVLGGFVTLVPEYALLHLAVQSREHSYARLSRVVDIDRLARMRGFDWGLLASLAARTNARVALHTSLRISAALLGTPMPEGFIEAIGAPAIARWHMALLVPEHSVLHKPAEGRAAISLLVEVWSRDRVIDRLTYLLHLLQGRDSELQGSVTGGTRASVLLRNSIRLMKIALYQLYLYFKYPFTNSVSRHRSIQHD